MKQRDIFARQSRLRQLGYRNYQHYLRSPAWQATKARYRASDLPQECMCGETEGIHLHHTTYERVAEEELTDLIPLCARCHEMIHVLERRGDIALDLDGLEDADRAHRNAQAIAEHRVNLERERTHERERRKNLHWVLRAKEMREEALSKRINIRNDLRVLRRINPSRQKDIEKVLDRIQSRLDEQDAHLKAA